MHQNSLNANKLRQIAFLLVLTVLAVQLYLQLKTFIPAALGALTFYMVLFKHQRVLVYRKKWGKAKAATLLLLVSFVVVLLPILLLASLLSSKVAYAVAHSTEFVTQLQTALDGVEQQFHLGLASKENLQKIGVAIANSLPNILGATFDTLSTIGFMYFILYFMLTNSVEMDRWMYRNVPLKNTNIARIGKDLKVLVISNAVGIPLIAILQGVVAFFAYWFLGVKEPLFWLVVTAIAGMIPFVGAALAYVPLGIFLCIQEPTWKGITLLLYGFLVVGTVDNVARFALQKKIGDVHPLITIFGVVIGLQMFGFIGLVFGPILISMFILLAKVYLDEFATDEEEEENSTDGAEV
jgi:predicted PurR-regulated permease PerM